MNGLDLAQNNHIRRIQVNISQVLRFRLDFDDLIEA